MTVSPAQSRAARALLNLSQSYVGSHTNIGQARLSNYESQNNGFMLSGNALIELEQFYISRGIELTGQDGVRRKSEVEFKVLEGVQGFRALIDDVYQFACMTGGNIAIINGSADEFIKWLGEDWYTKHAARMEAIKHNVNFRIITGQQSREIASAFATYKTIPGRQFSPQTIYLYGDNVGFIIFSNDEVRVFKSSHKEIAETLHYMFDLMWDKTQ